MYQATQGFVRTGCAVLRFNYRGAGTSDGEFSDGPGEMDDYRAALDAAAREFPELPIWAAGYSFGAHIAMNAGASDPRVTHLIGIGVVIDDKYDYGALRVSGEAEVPAARRARRASLQRNRFASSTASWRSRANWLSSTTRIITSMVRERGSPTRLKICSLKDRSVDREG